jgi:Mn2+/Fe2+ NRAMP family transporter
MYFLVYAGIVQGFSAPPLFLLIVLMTNNRTIMGDSTNSIWLNVLAVVTLVAIFAASLGLVLTWLL